MIESGFELGRGATLNSVPGGSKPKRAKLSVNVNHRTSERLRNIAYQHRLSESSIVEIALKALFAEGDDTQIGTLLRQLGATLRSK